MKYTKDNPLKVITLCSGYDSQCLALNRLKEHFPDFDYELVAWSEFDPESKAPIDKQPAVIAHNALFPQWADRNLGDMTKINWKGLSLQCDLLFYSTPCFVAGTLVMTAADGLKPIEEVVCDDMVLTHKNRFKKVLQVGRKPSSDIIKVRAMMFDEILCTPNHPFLTREMYRKGHKGIRMFGEPQWKNAEELTKKDYLGFAINQKSEIPTWDGVALHRGTHWDVVNEISPLLENENFWYVIGRYIGDGWQRNDKTHKAILIACSDRNKDNLLQTIETLGWKYTYTKERTCNRVTIYGKELCEFVNRYGQYAHGKRIDAETLSLPVNLITSLLNGYVDSDGCFTRNEYRITTVSRELAYGLMQIVAKCHKRPSRMYKVNTPNKSIIEGREVNQRNTYVICWHTDRRKQDKAFYEDGYVWFPIKEVAKANRKEFVYNMEVEEDNSYTANGAIVHNCQSISQAGLQHGFTDGSGTRSSIIWNVRDAVVALKPKYLCLENVSAMVSKKFIGMFNLWQSALERLGYCNFAQLMNAKDYGVAQNRDRIFLVSIRVDDEMHLPNYHFPKPFELTKKLKDYLEDKVDERYYLSDERVQGLIASTEKEQERGNGFAWHPTDGDGTAHALTTTAGSRKTDNFLFDDYE